MEHQLLLLHSFSSNVIKLYRIAICVFIFIWLSNTRTLFKCTNLNWATFHVPTTIFNIENPIIRFLERFKSSCRNKVFSLLSWRHRTSNKHTHEIYGHGKTFLAVPASIYWNITHLNTLSLASHPIILHGAESITNLVAIKVRTDWFTITYNRTLILHVVMFSYAPIIILWPVNMFARANYSPPWVNTTIW